MRKRALAPEVCPLFPKPKSSVEPNPPTHPYRKFSTKTNSRRGLFICENSTDPSARDALNPKSTPPVNVASFVVLLSANR